MSKLWAHAFLACGTLVAAGSAPADCLERQGQDGVDGCAYVPDHPGETGGGGLSFSLLQSRLSLQTEDGLPPLKFVARSYYSSSPSESVKWIQRYLNGKEDSDTFAGATTPGSTAAGANLFGWKTVFLSGATVSPEADEYVQQVKTTWTKAMADHTWTVWGDFHDGTYLSFNLTNAAADGLSAWVYDSEYPIGLARFYIPGTMWTLEGLDRDWDLSPNGLDLKCDNGSTQHVLCHYAWSVEDSNAQPCPGPELSYLLENTWAIPEPGRKQESVTDPHTTRFMWKVTYAVVNASSAKDFAIDVLGATLRDCPFGYPPTPDSGGGYWLYAFDEELELHYVESGNSSEHDMIRQYHELYAAKSRELTNGCLHQLLYNSLIFQVDTLDPFVEKLNSWQTPYLAVQTGPVYSLIFAFPGNEAVVVQLQSSILTKASARSRDELVETC